MCDLFLLMSESNVVNYADGTTLYAYEKKLYAVQRKLESQSLILFEWFHNNYLKGNSGKSHAMLTTDHKLKISVKGSPISKEKIVKLLGVTVDNKLSFEPHLNLLCKKVSQKFDALARVSKFISKKKLRVTMNSFIMSQFSYCSLVWMCHSRTKRNVTNNFRKNSTSETRNVKFVYYGLETISFLDPKIWELLPSDIKDSENLNIIKSNIKSLKPENCPCRLCRLYIGDIGFIEL